MASILFLEILTILYLEKYKKISKFIKTKTIIYKLMLQLNKMWYVNYIQISYIFIIIQKIYK